MTLTFSFFGYEVARINLDIEQPEKDLRNPVDRVIKGFSKLWVKEMLR